MMNRVDVGFEPGEVESDDDKPYNNRGGSTRGNSKRGSQNFYNQGSRQYKPKKSGTYDSDSYNGSGSGSNERQKQSSLNSKESQDTEFMHQL